MTFKNWDYFTADFYFELAMWNLDGSPDLIDEVQSWISRYPSDNEVTFNEDCTKLIEAGETIFPGKLTIEGNTIKYDIE